MTEKGESRASRLALQFYGGKRCVLTGRLDTHWHHLDENHHNWKAVNIVPLSGGLNQSIETAKHKGHSSDSDLDLDAVDSRAKSLFPTGEFRYSYGAARLGSFLAKRSNHFNRSLKFAAGCLISLRSSPDLEYFQDTLLRSVIPLICDASVARKVDRYTRFLVGIELASWLRDYGHPLKALEVHNSCATMLDAPVGDPSIHVSRAMHSRASSLLALEPGAISPMLTEAEGLAHDADFVFGVSNVLVTRIDAALRLGRLDEARKCLEKSVHFCRGTDKLMGMRPSHSLDQISWWMAAELLGLKAEIESRRKRAKASRDTARRAIEIYQETRIQPRAGALTPTMRSMLAELPAWKRPVERKPSDLKPCMKTIDKVIVLLGSDVLSC